MDNVYAMIIEDYINSPIFLTKYLTFNSYLTMLQNVIDPMITKVIENSVNFHEVRIINNNNKDKMIVFQYGRCPIHWKKKRFLQIIVIRIIQIDGYTGGDNFRMVLGPHEYNNLQDATKFNRRVEAANYVRL